MHWLALLPSPPPATDGADGSDPTEQTRQALAWWALQFTPRVARLEEAVVLEVEASLRLFGGRLALHERLRRESVTAGLPLARIAWAPNSLAALTLARAGVVEGLGKPIQELLDPLPFTHLSALAAQRPMLARLGLKRLGDVRRLPRAALARRLGPEMLLALDRVYGQVTEPAHDWATTPERFALKRELRERIEHAPVLLHAAEPLLVQACAWLAARHAGLRRLTLRWAYDAMRARGIEGSGSLTIATAHTTRDLNHLRRLLGEHLARATRGAWEADIQAHAGASCGANLGAGEALGAPQQRAGNNEWPRKSPRPEGLTPEGGRFGVAPLARGGTPGGALRLASPPFRGQRGPGCLPPTLLAAPVGEIALHIDEALPLTEASAELLPAARLHDGEAMSQLLERLAARLGPERVRRGRIEDDHRPERAQAWGPWDSDTTLASAPARPGSRPRPALPEPSWLLAQPQRLSTVHDQPQYQGPLQLLAGPQRIEGGWWQLGPDGRSHTQAQRDYFIAQSERAGLLWVFSERLSLSEQGWFLHGFFA